MDQNLIEELWKHTDEAERKNTDQQDSDPPVKIKEQANGNSPVLLTASHFFRDFTNSLFLSFHHESANQMRHYHDFFELIYVCKGNPVSVIDSKEIPLKEGNLCIMNPNAVHYFKKYKEDSDLVLNIVLPKDLFQKSIFRVLFNDPVLNAFFIRYRIENKKEPSFMYLQNLDKNMDYLMELLIKEYLNKKEYSRVIIESLLTLIFSFLLRNYKERSSYGNHAMAKVMDYIYLNHQNTTMESVAAHFNYHPKYLSYLIHKETGRTYRNLIVTIKLQNSLNYLLYTNYSVEQIVELIGYKDKSSFYNLFKRVYGMSPAEYRKKHL